MDIEILSGAWE